METFNISVTIITKEFLKMAVRDIVKERIDIDIDEPSEYRLILWNDDFTPTHFVVYGLMKIGISKENAVNVMYLAHTTGKAVVGTYPYEIANSMKEEAIAYVHGMGSTDFKMTVEEDK